MKIKDLKLNENFEITRFLYKPGWSVKFMEDPYGHGMYEIRILHLEQPDASKFKNIIFYQDLQLLNKKQPIVLRSTIDINYFKQMKEIDFWNYLFEQVRSVEMHEIKEWFKIDGKYLRNPHPEDPMGAAGISESECFNA